MAEPANVRLSVASRAENVMLVRETLTGAAEHVRLDRTDLNDVHTAVTEACNNVVLHAYPGSEGPMEVDIHIAAQSLGVAVRDHGTGIWPRIRGVEEGVLGLGLTVIQTLVDRVEFRSPPGGGTEVRMEFAVTMARPPEPLADGALEPASVPAADLAHTSRVAIAPTALARTVLPRVLCALAMRARFSTDRISDVQLVADTLAAHSPAELDVEHLNVSVRVLPRALTLALEPLAAGGAARLMAASVLGGLGSVIGRLTDEHETAPARNHTPSAHTPGDAETLTLRLVDRR